MSLNFNAKKDILYNFSFSVFNMFNIILNNHYVGQVSIFDHYRLPIYFFRLV